MNLRLLKKTESWKNARNMPITFDAVRPEITPERALRFRWENPSHNKHHAVS